MAQWSAQIAVDEPLARALIAEQFPALAETPVVPLGEGWDNTAFVVGGEWVFRFPRREIVVEELEKEIVMLPRLAPLLPVVIPVPELVGAPGPAFPWPFFGARHIAGLEACDADAPREALARELGRAVRVLHSPAVLAAIGGDLPENRVRRVEMDRRVPATRAQLERIGWHVPKAVEDLLDAALTLPPPLPAVVCHGDLHFRHVLVHGGRLNGIIDWIDLCRGDPGLDLQIAWSFFAGAERTAFFDEYGDAAADSLLRARVLAFFLNGALAEYARAEGLRSVEREALASLERASP